MAEPATEAALFRYSGGSIDITPPTSVTLAGYSQRHGTFNEVESPLEANAMLLIADHTRVLFVSVDLLFAGAQLTERIQARAALCGLSASNVIVVASHTHFAPATDVTKPALGEVDHIWMDWLCNRLDRLVDQVLRQPAREVRVVADHEEAGWSVNRRRRWPLPTLTRSGWHGPNGVVMAPNHVAPVDPGIDLLRITDLSGRIVAVIWKYACHPVGFPRPLHVCAEFPGLVRARIRSVVGTPLPILFWQGFAGDVRPRTTGRQTVRNLLGVLRRGPTFRSVTFSEWYAWATSLAAAVVEVAIRRSGTELPSPLCVSATKVALSEIVDAADNPSVADRSMVIKRVRFGSCLSVLFVGAEVCSPWVERLGSLERTICVGYTDDVFGYLPTAEQTREGGYEGRDFMHAFGFHGELCEGFEQRVVNAVSALNNECALRLAECPEKR